VTRTADCSVPERYYTVKEAAEEYFQGKVSAREVYALFAAGALRGFRVGAGKGRILIYLSSLECYRRSRENGAESPVDDLPPPPTPPPATPKKRRPSAELPAIRLSRLPEPTSP
jgi:hypothetical protein